MEIKPQDLRVGNAVLIEGVLSEVHTISQQGGGYEIINGHDPSDVEGIKLTPEWLERADFKLVDETMASGVEGIKGPYYAKDALLLWSNGSEPKSAYLVFYADGFFGKYKAVRGRWIHTVHDLQNTYHAWKGEELAIDKTSLKN